MSIQIDYTKSDDEKKLYVMCPTFGCTYKLDGTWKNYATGVYKNGLMVYKCPKCQKEFTINDFKVNAVPIPNEDGLAVLYNTRLDKIILKIPGSARFTDVDNISYIHVPYLSINKDVIMVYLSNSSLDLEELQDVELLSMIKNYLNDKKKK